MFKSVIRRWAVVVGSVLLVGANVSGSRLAGERGEESPVSTAQATSRSAQVMSQSAQLTSQSAQPATQSAIPPSTSAPSTRRSRVVGATSAPSFRTLPPIPKPFVGTTRPVILDPGTTPTPTSLDELRSLERQVEAMTKRVIPATVCLQIGQGSGSGVIVSPDGWILTAGHVSTTPDQPVVIRLHDGRRVHGVTLGANHFVDSGLVRLTDPGPWPYAEIGESDKLKLGQWLVSIGHPGGYKVGRAPVVRLGRLLMMMRDDDGKGDLNTLMTDNTLVGGDSGGPLFDLDGRVVGIHSRISMSVEANMHIPSDVFVRDWSRIAAGEEWGELGGAAGRNARTPWLGVKLENVEGGSGGGGGVDGGVKVTEVTPDSPADKAGLRVGDVIYKVDGNVTPNSIAIGAVVASKKPGDVIGFEIRREGAEDQVIRVKLGEPRGQQNRRRNPQR